MKTIGRNATKKIAAIQKLPLRCMVFELGNNFKPVVLTSDCHLHVWSYVLKGEGKLTDHEDGTYTVRLHANKWYTFLPTA